MNRTKENRCKTAPHRSLWPCLFCLRFKILTKLKYEHFFGFILNLSKVIFIFCLLIRYTPYTPYTLILTQVKSLKFQRVCIFLRVDQSEDQGGSHRKKRRRRRKHKRKLILMQEGSKEYGTETGSSYTTEMSLSVTSSLDIQDQQAAELGVSEKPLKQSKPPAAADPPDLSRNWRFRPLQEHKTREEEAEKRHPLLQQLRKEESHNHSLEDEMDLVFMM